MDALNLSDARRKNAGGKEPSYPQVGFIALAVKWYY
jgi:hypothetical protein